MTLAAILLISLFAGIPGAGGPGIGPPLALGGSLAQDQPAGQNSSAPSASPAPVQSTNPKPSPSAAQNQTTGSSSSAKRSAKKKARHKKASVPDCSDSAAPLNSGPGQSSAANDANKAGSRNAGTVDANSNSGTTAKANPCPPAKKVVTNGGSDAPTIELTHNTSEQQASQQRFTTDQLRTATEENLKKIEGRQLNTSQQDMVSQIKQFMDQSKSAVADGDLERGRSLAMKAQLLSEELTKP
jgi:hypothetical protein